MDNSVKIKIMGTSANVDEPQKNKSIQNALSDPDVTEYLKKIYEKSIAIVDSGNSRIELYNDGDPPDNSDMHKLFIIYAMRKNKNIKLFVIRENNIDLDNRKTCWVDAISPSMDESDKWLISKRVIVMSKPEIYTLPKNYTLDICDYVIAINILNKKVLFSGNKLHERPNVGKISINNNILTRYDSDGKPFAQPNVNINEVIRNDGSKISNLVLTESSKSDAERYLIKNNIKKITYQALGLQEFEESVQKTFSIQKYRDPGFGAYGMSGFFEKPQQTKGGKKSRKKKRPTKRRRQTKKRRPKKIRIHTKRRR
tara:strand:- start:178 stop:1113 length:936 start_codon:yes stop_codon:yes gene_type:complete